MLHSLGFTVLVVKVVVLVVINLFVVLCLIGLICLLSLLLLLLLLLSAVKVPLYGLSSLTVTTLAAHSFTPISTRIMPMPYFRNLETTKNYAMSVISTLGACCARVAEYTKIRVFN